MRIRNYLKRRFLPPPLKLQKEDDHDVELPDINKPPSSWTIEKLREMKNIHLYKLYFKGLISKELAVNGIKAEFGIAIFDHKDNLFYKTKGHIYYPENITPIEAEIRALIRGLDEALTLRINHISIFSVTLLRFQNVYALVLQMH
ncbi:E3 ubiquitin-protein ligase RSL1 [Cardamine amara subsp. amara]|uniref:E3 ubiquitin-protein ligase RSL1 n=1 Tax=Cardamine amara subsp. amara TaxID=228776 RepID=A0ABD1APB2_CARAN